MLNMLGISTTEMAPLFGGLRILIADESPAFLRRLRLSLQCIPQAEIVSSVSKACEFKRATKVHRPNVLITDTSLGPICSFDLISEAIAGGLEAEVIFLAASNDEAIRAFEISAADYVLKPASFERLRNAVGRAEARLWTRLASSRFSDLQQRIDDLVIDDTQTDPDHVEFLWFKNGSELCQVAVSDVEWFQAAGDYVIAHTGEQSHLVNESISGLEGKLSSDDVLRVHRSSIVNVNRIRSLRKRRPRGLAIVLSSGKQIVIGPKFESNVLALMNAPRWR